MGGPAHGGGGGPTYDGMETRVSRLESKVDGIARSISDLPTKNDLRNYFLQSLALGFAVMAVVIGGIIGGLSWIKPDVVTGPAPASQPVIIQLPPSPVGPPQQTGR